MQELELMKYATLVSQGYFDIRVLGVWVEIRDRGMWCFAGVAGSLWFFVIARLANTRFAFDGTLQECSLERRAGQSTT